MTAVVFPAPPLKDANVIDFIGSAFGELNGNPEIDLSGRLELDLSGDPKTRRSTYR